MKKFFYPLLLLMAMTFTFTACDDDDDVPTPNVTFEINPTEDDGDIEIASGDTLTFKGKVSNSTMPCLFHWTLNGEKVFDGPTYKFVSDKVGKYIVAVEVVNVEGGKASFSFEVEVYGKYKKGTFVLSEGNMSDETGKITFISPNGKVTDNAYFTENGSHLGAAAQDLWIEDGKMYIISQNGTANGGDGLLVVANAETLKKEAVYNDELSAMAKTWPTHIAVVDHQAYIRDNNGISLFDLNTKKLNFIEGTAGAAKNRMAEIDDKIFAIAGQNILVIENGAVINTIKMAGSISGILESSDDNLWVSMTTKPAQISKVNAKDYTVMATNEITEGGVGAGWGATPGIGAKGDTIYFSNASTTIYRHIFSQKKTEKMTNVTDHVADAKMAYNNLGVDPVTGEVYFTSIKGWSDFKVNDILVFDFDKQKAPVADYKNCTSFPAGVFFTESF